MAERTPGLCECGCGQPTRIAKASDPRWGHVKGQPIRFIVGHVNRGKTASAEQRAKMAVAVSGERGGTWKGSAVSYSSLHTYLCRHYPKTQICDECGQFSPKTEFALIHGRGYTRNREDYRELCGLCHRRYDGHMKVDDAMKAEMKDLRQQGWTYQKIGDKFGVCLGTARRAILGHR